jgi:hypothetical protein
LNEQRIYWTDSTLGYIKSAKVDGSDVQLITSGLSNPVGIDIHDNEIYFSEWQLGKIYKQAKSPGSSKILIHSDTPYMMSVKVCKRTGMYNVIKLDINISVSSFQIKVLQIYYLTLLIQYYPAIVF